ncbi:hypothetical protein LEP1GSC171_3937 [Leptospira santarosai str. HAI1380]|uniref:Uncharacterized protein n=3 Tax=Leptospira santarosai TaxID=28183 RepID=M6UTK6_9LEPT|nr:hypothetical protein LEP1GSC179_2762 [Leptospira santarosai str. MOR084]EKO78393.1 hypothetical protein LEP1GSC068_3486 [Leptospira sp. Fiocruz LV3954]EKS06970.1 hypothetical protein LEP1GSC071_0670 [Leptospira santarosai str. JET]EMF88813.1 hypothetical protein LEP1GSC005_1678 [Leptospira santarosai str. ST188]EMJ48406.1 hypothetical protein LEP1GSC169_0944 [Leptospira santarosai str. HAI1349]EMM76025.1 hypothetical protein LEP1GSC040_3690 [Leptospira santarosai str. 2000030832]EMM87530.1
MIVFFQSVPKSNSFMKVSRYKSEVLTENADSITSGRF